MRRRTSSPSTSPLAVHPRGPAAWCPAGGPPAVPSVSVQVPLDAGPRPPSPRLSRSEHSAPPRPSLRLTVRLYLTENFPKDLQCLNITVLSADRCKEAYPGQIDATMFCAGDEAGRDSCQVRSRTAPSTRQMHTQPRTRRSAEHPAGTQPVQIHVLLVELFHPTQISREASM